MHEKDFPALRIGNRIVVPKEVFIRWVEQQMFPPEHWTQDGIHPTAAGHRLIANAWEKKMQPTLMTAEK